MFLCELWKTGVVVVCFFLSVASHAQKDLSTWDMYQGNTRHTGFVPIDIDVNNIKQIWEINSEAYYYGEHHQAIIGQYYIFLATAGQKNRLEAFSPMDGHAVWVKDFGKLWPQPTAYSDGTLFLQTVEANYYGSDFITLTAYKEESGDVVFESFAGGNGTYKAPVIDNEIVYVCETELFLAKLVAYNKYSGTKLWDLSFDTTLCGTSLAVNNNYAIYYNKKTLFKIDKKTGVVLSSIKDEHRQENYDFDDLVLIGENSAYVTVNNYLTKYNLKKNKVDFALANVTSTPSTDDKNLYVIKDKYLTAINADTGKTVWKNSENMYETITGVVVTNNLVFISTKDGTKAYSKTKKHDVVWQVNDGGKLSLSTKGLLIVSKEGTLTMYKIK